MSPQRLLEPWSAQFLSVLRIVSALLFLEFGTAKLLGFPYVDYLQDVDLLSLYGVAGMLEIGGGFLLGFGVFTRLVAFILSGEMAFAYWIEHAPHSFFPIVNDGVAAVLFCFVFLYLTSAGGGPWSIDSMLERPN